MENMRELSMDEMNSVNGGADDDMSGKWRSLAPNKCPNCGRSGFQASLHIISSMGGAYCSFSAGCCHKLGTLYSNGHIVFR